MSLPKMKNSEAPWDSFDPQAYNKQYEGHIIWEDTGLGRATISMLRALGSSGLALRSIERGADVCNSGIPRGPALIAPYIADGGSLHWIDYAQPQIVEAQNTIRNGRLGNLGDWAIHQTDMGIFDTAWAGAVFRACELGEAVSCSIFELPEDEYGIASTWFGPESLTEDPDEWAQATRCLIRSVQKSGGLAIIGSMYGSTGYDSAGVTLPATPIYQEDVLRIAEDEGLVRLQAYTVLASHAARPTDDPFTYEAMGVVMGIRT